MQKKLNKKSLYILLLILAVVALFYSAVYIQEALGDLTKLLAQFNEKNSALGRAIFYILAGLSIILGPFTSAPLVPSAVVIWGLPQTLFLLISGWLTGNIISYFIGRFLGSSLVVKIVGKQKLEDWSKTAKSDLGFWPLFLFRLATPSETGYFFGILHYSFPKYMLMTFIAELPFAFLTVYASNAFITSGWTAFVILAALWTLIIFLSVRAYKKYKGEKSSK